MLDTKSENEAFGIFLRITNRKIRILPEGTLVARRVGGLEVVQQRSQGTEHVARRVGGLEVYCLELPNDEKVARRVGGLEVQIAGLVLGVLVARRVGGLEVLDPATSAGLNGARRVGGMVPVFSFSLPMRTARFSGLFFGSGPAEGAPVQEEGARPAHSGHLRLSSFALASTSIPGCGEPYPRAAARHSASSIGEACL